MRWKRLWLLTEALTEWQQTTKLFAQHVNQRDGCVNVSCYLSSTVHTNQDVIVAHGHWLNPFHKPVKTFKADKCTVWYSNLPMPMKLNLHMQYVLASCFTQKIREISYEVCNNQSPFWTLWRIKKSLLTVKTVLFETWTEFTTTNNSTTKICSLWLFSR